MNVVDLFKQSIDHNGIINSSPKMIKKNHWHGLEVPTRNTNPIHNKTKSQNIGRSPLDNSFNHGSNNPNKQLINMTMNPEFERFDNL